MNLSNNQRRLKNSAVYASIATAITLTLLKGGAAFITGSLSVLSSMADSLADIISSLVTLIAVIYADRPLTCEHRYGYGRAEAVSALVQAAFITGSACFILYDAVYRISHPVVLKQTAAGIGVMVISLILTAALICYQRFIIKRISSQAIEADNKHYLIDLAANGAVLISLLAVRYLHWEWIDMVAATMVSVYLIITAWQIARRALEEITDKEIDGNIKLKMVDAVMSISEVKGYHDFRSRISGQRWFIEMHLELDGELSLIRAHDIAETAENKIIALYPQAQVIIHQDPYGVQERRLDNDIVGKCSF